MQIWDIWKYIIRLLLVYYYYWLASLPLTVQYIATSTVLYSYLHSLLKASVFLYFYSYLHYEGSSSHILFHCIINNKSNLFQQWEE